MALVEAPSSNELVNLEQTPQANTAKIDFSGVQDNLMKASQLNAALKEARHQEQQKRIKDAIDVNLAQGDILPNDVPFLDKKTNEYLQWVKDNSKEIAAGNNFEILNQQKQKENELQQLTSNLIGAKKWYDSQYNYLKSGVAHNLGYGRDIDMQYLEQYKNSSPDKRVWNDYAPTDLYNQNDLIDFITPTAETNVNDSGYKKTTTTETPIDKIQAKINGIYQWYLLLVLDSYDHLKK